MMDSALCLHRGALHIPSTTSRAAGLVRPYSTFRPSSVSLFSNASIYRTLPLHTFSSPVIRALNKPSPPSPNNDKDNGKTIVRVVGGASVVLACVLGVINCNFNFSPTAIAGQKRTPDPQTTSTEFPATLTKPREVLDSMLTVIKILAEPKKRSWLKKKMAPQLQIPERPEHQDRRKLKTDVATLIKSGMCHEAEIQLLNLYNEKGGEPARDVEMELVLVYIFQGKYEEALKRSCLSETAGILSDGRVQFYKAIIYTMLGKDKEAEGCWEKFVGSFSSTTQENKSEVPHPKQEIVKK